MKKILVLLMLGWATIGFGQLTKMEVFSTGTKLSFYPGQCGNDIPEAAGKLTFCDKNDALGVVERSYGLNARGVKRMLDNHFNQDELYITRNGLSIRNENGTWENIPNVAMPRVSPSQSVFISSGLVLPSGKILLRTSINLFEFIEYDRVNKKIVRKQMPNNHYASAFLYDATKELTWLIARESNSIYLYTYKNDVISLVGQIDGVASVDEEKVLLQGSDIFIGNNTGLHRIDVSNYVSGISVTHYSTTTTPSLPLDNVLDMDFDQNGVMWLALGLNFNFKLVKLNLTTDTVDYYSFPKLEGSTMFYNITDIAISPAGVLWASCYNHFGLLKIDISGAEPSLTAYTGTQVGEWGAPFTYSPNNIYYRNNKFYYTTVDGSSGSNTNNEILINTDGTWSGRSDDDEGNLSQWMNSRFNLCLPDEVGGVWWFNSSDDIVVYRDADDNHQAMVMGTLGYSAAIDVDNKAIVNGGSPRKVRKIDFPNADSIEEPMDIPEKWQRAGNEIWGYDHTNQRITIYQDNVITKTIELGDTDYASYYEFAVDADSKTWFAKLNSDGLNVRRLDPVTNTKEEFVRPEKLLYLKKIVPAPDHAVWFVGNRGLVLYKGENWYSFLYADYPEFFNVVDAVVDENGKIYILTNDGAKIISIENPTSAAPTLTTINIEGYNSVLPLLGQYRPAHLVIDSEGSIWTHASLNAFKLVDADFAKQYIVKSPVATQDIVIQKSVTLMPNPTTGIVNIISAYPVSSVSVFDALGQNVFTAKNTKVLNLEGLAKGVYFVRVRSAQFVLTESLLIR